MTRPYICPARRDCTFEGVPIVMGEEVEVPPHKLQESLSKIADLAVIPVRISSYLTMFERLLRIPYVPVRCLFRSASVSSPFQYRE